MKHDDKALNKWAETLAMQVALDAFKQIEDKSRNLGSDATKFIATMFLSSFIGGLLFRTLNEKNDKVDPNIAIKNTGILKGQIQDAVSVGFQNAMSAFIGQNVEYYCQIKMVPEMTSKAVN